ncbi:hypothetical protein BJY16_006539 [Actinoplanes octamycinicus]|uniref:TROVE domain-containing protein n=1 Tax=Actinoplanes octamycinicus TaxID=135948 RepID=A0A7W7H342_9ACTN|nr:hypothetical protein [Actinoplanes octamycinicus]MBB4743080.1 hypothetical protein [Actinoplanes octamycinicus]GIE61358.1 hypothetical protein Aoc01nite_67600 [Actinoplanes octamycinicus]
MDRAARLACEDVIMFVNAAIASTAQREFHSGAGQQRMSLRFLHEYVLGNYRDLYAATLALDINHANAAMIVSNLLRTAREATGEQRVVEGRLIGARLRSLPPQRVYGLFDELRRLGVNNRRTRAIVRDWVAARPDPAFDAIKYRRGLSTAARHAHLTLPGEVGTALFDWRRAKHYATPILETWRRAHYEQRALYELPYTVAEGLAAKRGLDRARFLSGIAPRLTEGERLRLQAGAARHEVAEVAMDLARVPLTRLAVYALSLPRPERARRRDELTAALRSAARRAARRQAGTWGRVVAVLDDSYSAAGSGVKRRRPLAVALATHYLLEALAADYTGLWLHHRGDPLLVHPIGATGLGERILDGLEHRPDRLVIVSDGWDNDPPGLAGEVLRVWRTRLDPAQATSVVHLNPVYDAGTFDVRRLGPGVATVGLRDAEDAAALVELGRFATGDAGFDELRGHLAARVERFLEEVAA